MLIDEKQSKTNYNHIGEGINRKGLVIHSRSIIIILANPLKSRIKAT